MCNWEMRMLAEIFKLSSAEDKAVDEINSWRYNLEM